MIPEKALRKYIAVKALAEQGDRGERDNAARIARRMETQIPGIQKAAADYLKKQQAPPESAGSRPRKNHPPGVWPKTSTGSPFDPFGGQVGNWENIFAFAADMYQGFAQAAETVVDAMYGKELAQAYARTQVKMSQYSETILLTLRIPLEALEQAKQLNPMQQHAFRKELHDMLEAALDDLFED